MKKTAGYFFFPLLAVFFFAGTANALESQLTHTTQVATFVTAGNTLFRTSTTTAGQTLQSVGVWLQDASSTVGTTYLRATCFADSYSTSQSGCVNTAPINSQNQWDVQANQEYIFRFNNERLQTGKVYIFEILSTNEVPQVYGSPTKIYTTQCDFGGSTYCTGAPFLDVNSGIDWSQISFPLVYSSSTQAIAASSSLWQSIASASSTIQCATGNLFTDALCSAGVFLFVPSTAAIDAFTQLASTTLPQRFPFSWYYGVKNTYGALTASSTANMQTVSIDFSSVDPATSTAFGSILPNATVLSSTTISTYLSPTMLQLLLTLESAAIWLIFGLYVFHDVQHKWLNR